MTLEYYSDTRLTERFWWLRSSSSPGGWQCLHGMGTSMAVALLCVSLAFIAPAAADQRRGLSAMRYDQRAHGDAVALKAVTCLPNCTNE